MLATSGWTSFVFALMRYYIPISQILATVEEISSFLLLSSSSVYYDV